MSVSVETKDSVMTVILNRPEARNAVDRPTADALASAFLAFEHDQAAKVAVLWGAGGAFCAGADLKAVATGRGNRVTPIDARAQDRLATDSPMRVIVYRPASWTADRPFVMHGVNRDADPLCSTLAVSCRKARLPAGRTRVR